MFNIQETFSKSVNISKQTPVLIAYSGGVDSLALSLLAKDCFENITLAIVNHNLRIKAKDEANKALNTAKKLKLNTVILEITKPKPKNENLQDWARQNRYSLLINFAKENNIKHILTAHHSDDNAETILLNILRGTGIKGVKGILPQNQMQGVFINRPLLCFTKAQLKELVESKNLTWVEDPTNAKTDYRRNFLRSIFNSNIEDSKLIKNRLISFSNNLKSANEALDVETEKYFTQAIEKQGDILLLNLEEFKKLHSEFRFRIMLKILNVSKFRFEKINNIINYLCDDAKKVQNYSLYGFKITKKQKLVSFTLNP